MATLLIKELSSIITDGNEMLVKRVCIKDLISFLERIKEVLENSSSGDGSGDSEGEKKQLENEEALRESLRPAQQLVNKHKCKRRLYWIICLGYLNQEVEEIIKGIGHSLQNIPADDAGKLESLRRDIQQVHYEVLDGDSTEIKSLLALEPGIMFQKLAQDLGINFERDKQLLSRELRYLQADINESSNSERSSNQWQELGERVEDLLDALACENSAVFTQDENEAIPSFAAFECPLTRQVMKDPVVVIQSNHTYERHAIEEWFKTCLSSKREPTCPITGMVLASTELHPNLILRKAIEEWYQRNVAIRVENVRTKLSTLEDVDDALDELLKLAIENSLNKFTIKEANLIPEIAKIWTLEGAAYFRTKALVVLEKMADDADNQSLIVKNGLLRSTVKSLGSRVEEERMNAAKLLLTLSEDLEVCTKLATEKGAIIHLTSLTASKAQDVADVAEKTLKNLEKVDSNVLEMAEAGRLQPLLSRLCEGAEESQLQMARFLAKRHLVKSQKKMVAQEASESLLKMLQSSSLEAKEASLEVFLVLSSLQENRSLLLKAGLLPPLVSIMFNIQSSMNSPKFMLKATAANIVSWLVSTPGQWEQCQVDSEGNTIHSEPVIHNLLGLMMHIKPNWKSTLLEIFTGLASSSSEVAGETCTHILSGHGIRLFIELLSETTEASQRLNALKLLATISTRLGPEIVSEMTSRGGRDELERIKTLLKSTNNKEERAAAAFLLGNIPLTSQDLLSHLADPELIGWIIRSLSEILSSRHRSQTKVLTDLNEGLVGILIHCIKSSNPLVLQELAKHEVMNVLVSQLERQGGFLIKQRALLGIKHLSERAVSLTELPEPASNKCFCLSPRALKLCPVHSGVCNSHRSVCMIECKALTPVVEMLDEEDEGVQLAAMEALSTLLGDEVNLRKGVEELSKANGVYKIVEMCYGQQRGDLQERCVWMIERVSRVEDYAKSLSVDTRLFRALVEAFKSGNPVTKNLAQDSLTNLKQLSGISAGNRVRRQSHPR